jgi:hypothetical protein
MVFNAHSIQLTNGKITMPWNTLLAETPFCQAIFRTLNRHFIPSIRPGIRIAVPSSLEGGYAVEAARLGYQVLGFESRAAHFEACEFVKSHLDLPNLCFIQEEGKHLEKYGEFDAILCLGQLQEQDQPADFLELLGALTKEVLIVDTFYSRKRSKWTAIGKHKSPGLSKHDLLSAFRKAGFDTIYEQLDWLGNRHDSRIKRQDRGLFVGYKSA